MVESLLIDSRAQIQHAAFLGLAILALARGHAPEKWVGSILAMMALLEYPYHYFFGEGSTYEDINIGHLVIDVSVLLALIPIAMRANRIYPIWILAAQLISVTMHFNRELAPGLPPMAYWLMPRVPSYIQLVAFAIGLGCQIYRTRGGRSYRSWRKS